MNDENLRKKFDEFLEFHKENAKSQVWYKDFGKMIALFGLIISLVTCVRKDVDLKKAKLDLDDIKTEITNLRSTNEVLKTENTQLSKVNDNLKIDVIKSIENLTNTLSQNDEAAGRLAEANKKASEANLAVVQVKGELSVEQMKLAKTEKTLNSTKKTFKEVKGELQSRVNELVKAEKKLLNIGKTVFRVDCDLNGYLKYFEGGGLTHDLIANAIKPEVIVADRLPFWPTNLKHVVTLFISYPKILEDLIRYRIESVRYIDIIASDGKPVTFGGNKGLVVKENGYSSSKWLGSYIAYSLPQSFTVEVGIKEQNNPNNIKYHYIDYTSGESTPLIPTTCKNTLNDLEMKSK